MSSGVNTVIYPVKDLASAKALFTVLLGAEPDFDEPYYVGFRIDGQDIGLDPNGHRRGMTGPVGYYFVDDINATFEALIDAGAAEQEAVHDVGGGKLIASVTDTDGNAIGLMQMQ